MTTIKIGRVVDGDLTNIHTVKQSNTYIYDALHTFIKFTGVPSNQLIGFGQSVADILVEYLDATTAIADERNTMLALLEQDGSNDPFVMYRSDMISLISFEQVLQAAAAFNRDHRDADTADFLFMRSIRQHPIQLLTQKAQKDYISDALNHGDTQINKVVSEAILHSIESPNDPIVSKKLAFLDSLIETIDTHETNLEYDGNNETLEVVSSIADDIHEFLVEIGVRHPK